jgi:hypothetical protein
MVAGESDVSGRTSVSPSCMCACMHADLRLTHVVHHLVPQMALCVAAEVSDVLVVLLQAFHDDLLGNDHQMTEVACQETWWACRWRGSWRGAWGCMLLAWAFEQLDQELLKRGISIRIEALLTQTQS